MPQLSISNPNGFRIDVGNYESGEQGQISLQAFTVSVSDPSNTCNYDPANRILTPNGSNNTGTVAVTVTDSASGNQTVENLQVVAASDLTNLVVKFTPLH